MEVDLLVQQWLPMLPKGSLNWRLICLYVILKFANPSMRITVIGIRYYLIIWQNNSLSDLGICIMCLNLGFLFFVLSKYFPKHKLPENLIATTDAKAALLGADYCLHAVPVQVSQLPNTVHFDSCLPQNFESFCINLHVSPS